jgi:hypothetical protein
MFFTKCSYTIEEKFSGMCEMTNAYIISVTESEERYFLGTIDIEIRVIIFISVITSGGRL